MEHINIKQLAAELNLSISTVSKALRDSYEISPETKRRVLEGAQRLNYVPNPYASSLRRKKSRTIAVLVPDITNSFLALALNGIEMVAQAKGYHVLIYLTHETLEKEKAILQDFQSGRVDGVIISPTIETSDTVHMQALDEKGVPIVFFDRVADNALMASVATNDLESSYQATRHLLAQGCRHVAYLSVSTQVTIFRRRLEGYQQALADAGIPLRPEWVVHCTSEPEQNARLLNQLLQGVTPPDGVLASVEMLAIELYEVCRNVGCAIPRQLKVIGFSNLATASLLEPSLTTVTQPAFEMGKAAATILFNALESKHFNPLKASVVIPSHLLQRASTHGSFQ